MSQDTNEFVRRMYEALLDEIREQKPELLGESFTVAEIYQSLVPYRTHRDRIGTEMNGDYEDTLVRLLSGEGGYLEMESDTARQRLRDELRSVRPDTGIYRNFAACEVRLSQGSVAMVGNGAPPERMGDEGDEAAGGPMADEPYRPEERAEGPIWLEQLAPAEANGEPVPDGPPGETGTAPAEEREEVPGGEEDEDATCRWCRERLPLRDDLRFCPFCGSRVDRVPCPECGTELEEGWLFCVACGAEV